MEALLKIYISKALSKVITTGHIEKYYSFVEC
jgi:hypothetical protein